MEKGRDCAEKEAWATCWDLGRKQKSLTVWHVNLPLFCRLHICSCNTYKTLRRVLCGRQTCSSSQLLFYYDVTSLNQCKNSDFGIWEAGREVGLSVDVTAHAHKNKMLSPPTLHFPFSMFHHLLF